MHSSSAVNSSYQTAQRRTAERVAACRSILHSSYLGHWPATIHFTFVAQRDNLPFSANHRSPCSEFSACAEMPTEFADTLYDCGFDTQTHLHYRED